MNQTGSTAASTRGWAEALLRRHATRVEEYLRRALEQRPQIPPRLREAMAYSLLAGGKRLRPALVMESFACCQEPGDGKRPAGNPRPSVAAALAAAGAIELIHTFSLVHDDLPAMDDDELRRGRPTNHKVFGEAMAILAGDAMMMLAFEVLAEHSEGKKLAALVGELSGAAGPAGMIGGQALDIAAEHKRLQISELQRLHRMKTGALITASCRMGANAAGGTERQLAALTGFGRHLGLAFQIVDDLLDVTASSDQLGKGAGKDVRKGKNTYPSLVGVERAREMARAELDAAIEALATFGPSGENLRGLARFVGERTR